MNEYYAIILNAFECGMFEAQKILKPKDDEMSQREAYAEFGKAFVDKMVADGKVGYVRKGMDKKCKKTYSRAELTKAMAERNVLRCIIRLETARP